MTLPYVKVAKLWHGAERLLPEEFRALAAACEADPAERTPFGVVADWLRENDEPDFARAWDWLAARPGVVVSNRPHYEDVPNWRIEGIPSPLAAVEVENSWVSHTLAAAVAVLSEQLAELRRLVA